MSDFGVLMASLVIARSDGCFRGIALAVAILGSLVLISTELMI